MRQTSIPPFTQKNIFEMNFLEQFFSAPAIAGSTVESPAFIELFSKVLAIEKSTHPYLRGKYITRWHYIDPETQEWVQAENPYQLVAKLKEMPPFVTIGVSMATAPN